MYNQSSASSSPEQPPSLLTLTSIIVSNTYPFQVIEERYNNFIPDPIQRSLIFHSFPKHEHSVLVYASPDFSTDKYSVQDVVQIGFHVSGVVLEQGSSVSTATTASSSSSRRRSNSSLIIGRRNSIDNDEGDGGGGDVVAVTSANGGGIVASTTSQQSHYKVSLTFDRGKITSVNCSCESSTSSPSNSSSSTEINAMFWCDHVVALAIYRIRNTRIGIDFVLRVPISETLLQLNRSQLQKLVQYLISDHTDVLPTAQRLADELLFMKTDDNFINRIHGAPDPTAGPSITEPHSWALNEHQIQQQVRNSIATTSTTSSPTIITTLIEKIYKMIHSNDSNATRLLLIITNELVRHTTTSTTSLASSSRAGVSRSNNAAVIPNTIWDQIIRLWNVVVLKPNITDAETRSLEQTLRCLASNELLPECEEVAGGDEAVMSSCSSGSSAKRQKLSPSSSPSNSSIFKTPLQLLLRKYPPHDSQVLSLHSIACHSNSDNSSPPTASTTSPLQILNSLRKAYYSNHDNKSKSQLIRLESAHILFNLLKQNHEQSPQYAYESALIALTCNYDLKPTQHVYEKHLKLTEKLVGKLGALSSGTVQTSLLIKYVEKVLENSSDGNVYKFPLLSFSSYVFNTLPHHPLAYKLALKHLTIHQQQQQETSSNASFSPLNYILPTLEQQQITLATNLLTTSSNSTKALDEITSTLVTSIKSNTSLFRLAQEVFKHANSMLGVLGTVQAENLTNVSFTLSLHVTKQTKHTPTHRRRWEMVRYVVSCALEIGPKKLFHLVHNWGEYFSPTEAVGSVASNILAWVGGATTSGNGGSGGTSGGGGMNLSTNGSGNGSASSSSCTERGCGNNSTTSMATSKLGNVDSRIIEELGNAARNLAIQCAKNDPQNCALNTLTLCEPNPSAFETSYQIVLDSASKEFLTPQQIFTIARYMEHRGYTQRAYRLAVIAVQHVHIGYNQDTHSLISEIHWTCNLSHQLSTPMMMGSTNNISTTTPSTPSTSSSSSSSHHHHNHHHHSNAHHHHHNHHHHHHHHHHHQTRSSSLFNTYTRLISQSQHPHSSSSSSSTTTSSMQPPTTELENLIPLLIRNIKCATVLTEILRRSITIMSSYENAYVSKSSSSSSNHHQDGCGSSSSSSHNNSSSNSNSSSNRSSKKLLKQRVYEKLTLLIEGTIDSYITTTHSRLVNISPRHYSDFIEFLSKARENFLLAPNGVERFKHLVESMKCTYKGKKKLLFLLSERFG